jgi:diazepam-binding inhibitor (GABA receptor modulating acyl-CoA-binding protein)
MAFFIEFIMEINESFKSALEKVKSLDARPSNENLLKLYGLYKQATIGDIKEDRPGGFDFKAIAKYDSWASLRGMSQVEAMQSYIDLVDSLSA